MNELRLHLSSLAEQDLFELWDHIAKQSVTAADETARRLNRRMCDLQTHPALGEVIRCRLPDVRRIVVDPYLVFYRVLDDAIWIVRIIHSARDWERLL